VHMESEPEAEPSLRRRRAGGRIQPQMLVARLLKELGPRAVSEVAE
jgi:hypothetical protein